ncbi:MAG: response regulator [Alphaproteobacteria bacterium]
MARILLAEDDESMRGFLAGALSRAGHEVTAVSDGLDAVPLLERIDFDLLLADIVMPGMDGIDLAKRASREIPGLKVMLITGFAAVAIEARSMIAPRAKVLSKPFHLRALVDEVDKLLVA